MVRAVFSATPLFWFILCPHYVVVLKTCVCMCKVCRWWSAHTFILCNVFSGFILCAYRILAFGTCLCAWVKDVVTGLCSSLFYVNIIFWIMLCVYRVLVLKRVCACMKSVVAGLGTLFSMRLWLHCFFLCAYSRFITYQFCVDADRCGVVESWFISDRVVQLDWYIVIECQSSANNS